MSTRERPVPTAALPGQDRRVHRTREAVLHAFFELVTRQSYDSIRVPDILARAGVGRSTFYEHFRGKDAVLAASLQAPFTPLVDALCGVAAEPPLAAMLQHFTHNRALAQRLLGGPMQRRTQQILAGMIEQRLRADAGRLRAPPTLVAAHLAGATLAVVAEWTRTPQACGGAELADVLQRVTREMLAAWSR